MSLGSNSNRARWFRLGVASLGVIVIGVLVALALSRERGSALDGRWELILVELPTDSVQPANTSWIEFRDQQFQGMGDCLSFNGSVELQGERRISISNMTTETECKHLSAVDDAYGDRFSAVTTYGLSGGAHLTIQTDDASTQFTYTWAP